MALGVLELKPEDLEGERRDCRPHLSRFYRHQSDIGAISMAIIARPKRHPSYLPQAGPTGIHSGAEKGSRPRDQGPRNSTVQTPPRSRSSSALMIRSFTNSTSQPNGGSPVLASGRMLVIDICRTDIHPITPFFQIHVSGPEILYGRGIPLYEHLHKFAIKGVMRL